MAKYLKQDSDLGYIENSAEIEYLKLNNLRHSVLGFMLGDFDEQGFYTISNEIQKELIGMRKFIVNSVDNIDICHGTLMLYNPITFMVTFESDRATLSLVEKVRFEANKELNSGTYSNVNEFILDEVETAGEIDRNLVYRRWNIGEYGENVLGFANMDAATLALYSGLVERYKYLLAANKILLEKEDKLEDVEAEYAAEMMEVLSHYPALKTLVDAEIKSEVQEKTKFLRLDKPNFVKTFNEILDQAIENNIGSLNGSELNMFSQEKRDVTQKRNLSMHNELNIKQQTTVEEESNQTDLDEAFGTRTDKKFVLDAGMYSGQQIGELQTAFEQAEAGVTDLIVDAALGYFAAKTARSIIEGRLNRTQRYSELRHEVVGAIRETAGINEIEFVGEENRQQIENNIEQANNEKETSTTQNLDKEREVKNSNATAGKGNEKSNQTKKSTSTDKKSDKKTDKKTDKRTEVKKTENSNSTNSYNSSYSDRSYITYDANENDEQTAKAKAAARARAEAEAKAKAEAEKNAKNGGRRKDAQLDDKALLKKLDVRQQELDEGKSIIATNVNRKRDKNLNVNRGGHFGVNPTETKVDINANNHTIGI